MGLRIRVVPLVLQLPGLVARRSHKQVAAARLLQGLCNAAEGGCQARPVPPRVPAADVGAPGIDCRQTDSGGQLKDKQVCAWEDGKTFAAARGRRALQAQQARTARQQQQRWRSSSSAGSLDTVAPFCMHQLRQRRASAVVP